MPQWPRNGFAPGSHWLSCRTRHPHTAAAGRFAQRPLDDGIDVEVVDGAVLFNIALAGITHGQRHHHGMEFDRHP
jgi:hypothetical protein